MSMPILELLASQSCGSQEISGFVDRLTDRFAQGLQSRIALQRLGRRLHKPR